MTGLPSQTDGGAAGVKPDSGGARAVPREDVEQALRESEERFQALFERAPLGYQSLDAEGRFLEVNQTWLDTLGYAREEVIGRWFGDFLAPGFVEAFRERFPLFKAAGKIHSEFQMVHKNGGLRHIAFEGRIGYKADGSFLQTHCILSDITERKQAELKVAEQLAELRRWCEVTMGRENRVLELKREVNDLLVRQGQPPRYPSVLQSGADGGAESGAEAGAGGAP